MKNFLVLLLIFFLASMGFSQYEIPEKPKSVVDQKSLYELDGIDLLSDSQVLALRNKLESYEDSTGTQIVICIIKSTYGENISQLGALWGEKWGIGQKEKDNGVFILLAKEDRTIDINTGYGVFYYLTNRDVEQIINRKILPEFKKGDYYAGLDAGTNALIDALSGKFKDDSKNGSFKDFLPFLIFFLVIVFFFFSGSGRGGPPQGGFRRRGLFGDMIVLSNQGRSGSGGFGGGFSGGFGGGSFGGSGASGSW